jgi:hypothetical protein
MTYGIFDERACIYVVKQTLNPPWHPKSKMQPVANPVLALNTKKRREHGGFEFCQSTRSLTLIFQWARSPICATSFRSRILHLRGGRLFSHHAGYLLEHKPGLEDIGAVAVTRWKGLNPLKSVIVFPRRVRVGDLCPVHIPA